MLQEPPSANTRTMPDGSVKRTRRHSSCSLYAQRARPRRHQDILPCILLPARFLRRYRRRRIPQPRASRVVVLAVALPKPIAVQPRRPTADSRALPASRRLSCGIPSRRVRSPTQATCYWGPEDANHSQGPNASPVQFSRRRPRPRLLASLADVRYPHQHCLLCAQVAQSDAISRHSWESTPFARISKWSCATPDASGVLSSPRACQLLAGSSCSSSDVFAARTSSPGLSRRSPVPTVPANIVSSAPKSRKAT